MSHLPYPYPYPWKALWRGVSPVLTCPAPPSLACSVAPLFPRVQQLL